MKYFTEGPNTSFRELPSNSSRPFCRGTTPRAHFGFPFHCHSRRITRMPCRSDTKNQHLTRGVDLTKNRRIR